MTAEELSNMIEAANATVANAIDIGEIAFESDSDKEAFQLQVFLNNFSNFIIEKCAKECEALDAYLEVKEERYATGKECAEVLRSLKGDEEINDTDDDQ